MYPTFQRGDFYFVNKLIYNFGKPERGDVIIIKDIWSDEYPLIKRIIGGSGDTMAIKEGEVYLKGELLDEPYAEGETYPNMGPFRIGEDRYFVLGDNREYSYDSRDFGFIKRSEIRSKIAPFKIFTLR